MRRQIFHPLSAHETRNLLEAWLQRDVKWKQALSDNTGLRSCPEPPEQRNWKTFSFLYLKQQIVKVRRSAWVILQITHWLTTLIKSNMIHKGKTFSLTWDQFGHVLSRSSPYSSHRHCHVLKLSLLHSCVAPILEIDSCYQAMSHRCKMEATVDAEKCPLFHTKQPVHLSVMYSLYNL